MTWQVFNITIAATDKATATIRKINDSMSRVTRPFEQVGKSFKSLGREIGFDKISQDLAKIGNTSRDAARQVGSIVAPMAALTSVASVGGIIALADGWAKLGRNITFSAQNIGIGTTHLQQYEGAARLAGMANGAMTQTLDGLGKEMQDAKWGRNNQALMLFNRMGVGIKRTKQGTMDVLAEYKGLAKYIYAMKDPFAQRTAADATGLSAMLPLIRQGPAAFDKYLKRVQQIGVMTPKAIAAADEFAGKLSEMDLVADNLKNTIGNALMPAIEPLITQLSAWVSKNRELISTDVGAWAKDFGTWARSVNWKQIGSDISTIFRDTEKVVNALGGVKGVLIEIAAYKTLSLAGDVVGSIYRIGMLTKAMFGLRDASKAAAAAEAAAAAGGAAPAAGAAGSGFLAKFLGTGGALGLLKAAMWAPRPAESPEEFKKHLQDAGMYGPPKGESYWQQWADVFHWRTKAPAAIAPHPLMRPKARTPVRADDNINLFGNSKLTRGIRNNNPGNIRYGDFARSLGAIGADSAGFAVFPSAQQGLNAISANLRSYGTKGFNTPFEIAHRWSTTDQSAYTQRLAGLFGGDPNKQLNMSDPAVISALRNGIITQENGSNPYVAPVGPYSKATAQAPVSGSLHLKIEVDAPTGTRVNATPSENTTTQVRVGGSQVGAIA